MCWLGTAVRVSGVRTSLSQMWRVDLVSIEGSISWEMGNRSWWSWSVDLGGGGSRAGYWGFRRYRCFGSALQSRGKWQASLAPWPPSGFKRGLSQRSEGLARQRCLLSGHRAHRHHPLLGAQALDPVYESRRNVTMHTEALSTARGLQLGLHAMRMGVKEGAVGLVHQPLRGAIEGGQLGFFKGLGSGSMCWRDSRLGNGGGSR